MQLNILKKVMTPMCRCMLEIVLAPLISESRNRQGRGGWTEMSLNCTTHMVCKCMQMYARNRVGPPD